MDSTFDWDDLLDCIEEQSVMPTIGQDFQNIAIEGTQQTLAQWLADAFNVYLDSVASQNLHLPFPQMSPSHFLTENVTRSDVKPIPALNNPYFKNQIFCSIKLWYRSLRSAL